ERAPRHARPPPSTPGSAGSGRTGPRPGPSGSRRTRRGPTRGRARSGGTRRALSEWRPPLRPGARAGPRRSFGELENEARDRRRHEGDEGSGQQRAEAQPRQVGLAGGREAADPSDLDADRGEVGKAAEGEGRDELALLRQTADDVLHHREGEELV